MATRTRHIMTIQQPAFRGLGRVNTILWRLEYGQMAVRPLTTYHLSLPVHTLPLPHPMASPKPHINRHIKALAPPPSYAATCKEPLKTIEAQQIEVLDPTGTRSRLIHRSDPEAAHVGDILLVRQKNGDPFAGVCINIRRRGIDSAILLRNELTKVGVEMWYKVYSPHVEGVEIVQRKAKRARRARLTYMRKPKHDMGSVQAIVTQYERTKSSIQANVQGDRRNSSGRKAKSNR